jgi:hypothetical protein
MHTIAPVRLSTTGLAILAAVLLAASPASAATIIGFGDPLSDPALAGGTQQGFDSVADGDYASITLGDVTYIGVDAPLTIGPDFNGDFNTTGGKSLFTGFDLIPHQFRFDFAVPLDAFAFNWGASDNVFTLNAYGSADELLATLAIPATTGSNAGDYFGLAAEGMSYAILTDTFDIFQDGDFVFIDRFTTLESVSVVPEPTTLLLFGSSAVALAVRRRLRR